MCNFLEYKGNKIVYRKYASLFFCFCIDADDNELLALEVIHRFVECLDKHYGNVCELDIVYGMSQAYAILDELIVAGEMQESKLKSVNNAILGAHHSELEETLQLNLIGNDK